MLFQDLKTCIQPIIQILRWNKPTGRLILLIPAGWSLWLTPNGDPSFYLIIKILLGGLFVSGFGCVANDIWDKEIDKKVKRTKNRPLASNRLKIKTAYSILILFLLGSFFITLSLPSPGRTLCILLALIALPIILIYPSAKRWFRYPQAILSICWGFSVLIPWAAHEGNLLSPVLFFCWLATIFWTFGFDTIYALADKKYDQRIGINSSAINLGSHTKLTIQICYLITSLSLAFCSILNQLNFIFLPFLILTSILMQRDVINIFQSADFSISIIGKHFKKQVIYGSLILLGMILA